MKVLVGSKNPVKLQATEEAFSEYFDKVNVIGFKIPSNVPDQPFEDDTFKGAENRAIQLAKLNEIEKIKADYFVGIEGGVSKIYKKYFAFGGMCIINKKMKKSFGTSSHFELPDIFTEKLLQGIELGTVIDEYTQTHNTKQKSGAIGFFTKGKLDRKNLYIQGLTVALIPFLNEDLYFDGVNKTK